MLREILGGYHVLLSPQVVFPQALAVAHLLQPELEQAVLQAGQFPGILLAPGVRKVTRICSRLVQHRDHVDDQGRPQPPEEARGPGGGVPYPSSGWVRAMPDKVGPAASGKRCCRDSKMQDVATLPRLDRVAGGV